MFPVQRTWKLAADFAEPRPLEGPKTHVHGAWDIAVPVNTPIYAEVSGKLYKVYHRRRDGKVFHDLFWLDKTWFAFSHYYWEVWGCLIILEGDDGKTYVHAHCPREQTMNFFRTDAPCTYQTFDKTDAAEAFHNLDYPVHVSEGDLLGTSGNDGYSTGPHIHLEIHKGRNYTPHADRPDPAVLWPDEWRAHGGRT